jgi:hypothetical protein
MLKITRVVLSNHEIALQLDGSVAGRWIELLRQSVELSWLTDCKSLLIWKTFALSTVKDLRLSRA